MIIETNIKSKIKSELIDAKSFWIATAMISNNGWNFIPTRCDHLAHVLTAMPMSMVEEERGLYKNNITKLYSFWSEFTTIL